MAISWDSFDKIWASTSPLTPYSFSDPNYAQGWNFVGSTPPARQMWDSIQKQNDEKFKYLRDNFGTPNIVTQASQMTDTDKVYVYLGSEAGWNSGHWYYYDEGTSSWADGGVYNSVAFVTDTTLSIAGQPADAKATGDALALKSDLAGCTFTGNVGINADLSVTGDATIGTDLSVTGVSTLTGNVSAGADVTVVGDVSSANLTTGDATIGGDLSVTGTSTLAGNITTSGDISADNISATTNATVGGNLSVTGTSTLTGNINAGADITVVGDVSADNLTTTTNATVGGSLSVAGTSTLTGNVTTNGNITAVGDISSANLTTTNATIGGNATVTGDVSCANLTTSADASVGGDLTVTGDSTLADTTVNDLVVNNDLSVAGDSSLTNLSVSGTTALAGTSTAPTPSADDNSTKIATTEYVQTEIKPIEVNADIVNKRVTNIEKLLQGNLYDYQTDSDSKYTKTVPNGAMPYASLDSVGGKTVVWNQIIPDPTMTSTSNWYLPITPANLSMTATDNVLKVERVSGDTHCVVTAYTSVVAGHSYYITAEIRGDVNRTSQLLLGNKYIAISTTTNFARYSVINTPPSPVQYQRTGFGVLGSDFVGVGAWIEAKNLWVCDLTLMFGAGNEPTTVAEFQQQFPAPYYAFTQGQLLSAGVTSVNSVGKNLADYSGGRGYPDNTAYSNTTKRILPINKYVVGLTANNYYSSSNVSSFAVSDNTITFKNTNLSYGVAIPFACVGGSSYTFSFTSVSGVIRVSWYGKDGTIVSAGGNNRTSPYTENAPSTATIGVVVLLPPSINTEVTFTNIQAEKTASATAYSAPFTISTPIPAEVQALNGYGWSTGSMYNYIDYEAKKFIQNVGSRAYASGDESDSTVITDMTTTYYPLNPAVETDISAYLTDDNLISVESGGTLTFENQNGDDYRIPVPSAETYMVDLQEAI